MKEKLAISHEEIITGECKKYLRWQTKMKWVNFGIILTFTEHCKKNMQHAMEILIRDIARICCHNPCNRWNEMIVSFWLYYRHIARITCKTKPFEGNTVHWKTILLKAIKTLNYIILLCLSHLRHMKEKLAISLKEISTVECKKNCDGIRRWNEIILAKC